MAIICLTAISTTTIHSTDPSRHHRLLTITRTSSIPSRRNDRACGSNEWACVHQHSLRTPHAPNSILKLRIFPLKIVPGLPAYHRPLKSSHRITFSKVHSLAFGPANETHMTQLDAKMCFMQCRTFCKKRRPAESRSIQLQRVHCRCQEAPRVQHCSNITWHQRPHL